MKILFSNQIREADAYTIKNLPILSVDLMEKAAEQLFEWIVSKYSVDNNFVIFCGPGNNGGDGLALARMLAEKKYYVKVFLIKTEKGPQGDSLINYYRLIEQARAEILFIENENDLPAIKKNEIIIDALFGSGLSRPLDGLPAAICSYINNSNSEVISIDIPSGLFGEDNSGNNLNNVVKANYTLSLQFPKLSFFFPDSGEKVGHWDVLPIGLHKDFISSVNVNHYFISKEYLSGLVKKRNKFSHKGNFGHALLIAGSYGMMGAAVLASKACLRTGTGLLTTHVPRYGYQIMQKSFPECMVSIDRSDILFSEAPDLSPFSAVGIGPAIGCKNKTARGLEKLLDEIKVPLVIDADGLNILGENRHLLQKLPENTILTPHPKEFERIAGKAKNGYSRNKLQKEFSEKYKVIVVLKGAHTSVTNIDGKTYFNTTGNPGMATAGSGDVLTGIILSFLSQTYKPFYSALLGVYLHGFSGDIASKNYSEESLIASDMIEKLGEAWKHLKP
ncbi:NAD(P)H-hydrate dehydratase [Bacteroidota bacterium]